MGRPTKPSGSLFTSRELALAANLSPRNMALVHDEGLAPTPAESGGGRGGHRLYNSAGLAHAALIGATHLAGFELLVAARLSVAIAEDESHNHGKLLSNLATYLQRPFNPRPGFRPWGAELDIDDDFAVHGGLSDSIIDYRRGVALTGDMIIDIADHEYVLTEYARPRPLKVFSPVLKEGMPASPDYRIVGRGSAATIVPIIDEVDSMDFSMNPASAARYKMLQRDYLAARENAVARVRVNVSLAIRNAFDRVRDDRAKIAA
jgi:hypothetical protein